ncbi:MAG: hypothetical protein AAGI17_06165 [Planctomycetota bacterium]
MSVVETTVASVVVALAITASLTLVGNAMSTHAVARDRLQAVLLAESLLAEIIQLPYEDPAAPGSFGPGPGEDTRAEFDDIDDYDGWSTTNIAMWNGADLSYADGWRYDVEVRHSTLLILNPDMAAGLIGAAASQELQSAALGGGGPPPKIMGVNAQIKIIFVTVTSPRGDVTNFYAMRAPGGIGDSQLPEAGTTRDLVSVRITPGEGDAPIVITGPLLSAGP